jgi:putative sterol carrier protein
MSFAFLSDEWITAAREIRTRHEEAAAALTLTARINLLITEVPFGEGTIESYMEAVDGRLDLELGSLEAPDCTVTTDYLTARTLLVDQDPAAAMQAFMSGRIKVQGDMMKLMAMQTSVPDDERAKQVADEIRQITAAI